MDFFTYVEAERISLTEVISMAYRIEYDSRGGKFEVRKNSVLRFPLMVSVCFLLFLLYTLRFSDAGARLLRDCMIPGDNKITIRAWNAMTDDLRSGAGFTAALTAFCAEVLDGAQITD